MDALVVKSLTKRFGSKVAVNHFDLSIKEGEFLSLLGLNGAGKTTAIRMMTGRIDPSEGDIFIFGFDMKKSPQKCKSFLNVAPQEPAIAPRLTVEENLSFIASLYQQKDVSSRVEETLEEFSLQKVRKQKAKSLSGGYQKRLSLAMAFISHPKLLFLDEPTLGLDVISRNELWSDLLRLKKKITIVLTTHDLKEAEVLSDRVAILNHGTCSICASVDEILKQAGKENFEDAFLSFAQGEEQ